MPWRASQGFLGVSATDLADKRQLVTLGHVLQLLTRLAWYLLWFRGPRSVV